VTHTGRRDQDAARDQAIADALSGRGWAVCPGYLGDTLVQELARCARLAEASGRLDPAAIGAGTQRRLRSDIRSDRICWLEAPGSGPAEAALLQRMEAFRMHVNRALMLGLFDFECHYALYQPGARYARHLDRFAGDDRRTLSCVLYLNAHWTGEDGGQLRLHLEGETPVDVLPEGGTLATFLSDHIEHEVLPARRERLSIAGWFRRRGPPV